MNFFKRLFGFKPNPTETWPAQAPEAPMLDLPAQAVGVVKFGAPFAEAIAWGKPDRYRASGKVHCDLVYVQSGFSIRFEEQRFVFATYFLLPEEWGAENVVMRPSCPRVKAADGSLHTLDAQSKAEALVAVFGKPDSADVEEDESILEWIHRDLTIEAELNERGTLKRLNVFLTI